MDNKLKDQPPKAGTEPMTITCLSAFSTTCYAIAVMVLASGSVQSRAAAVLIVILGLAIPAAAVYCLFTKRPWHALGLFLGCLLPFLLVSLCYR